LLTFAHAHALPLNSTIPARASQGNLEVIDEIVADHVLGDDAAIERTLGRQSFKQVAVLFQTAFPDAHIPLFDLIAEGDKVVARWGLRGTHRDMFMGVPPTDKPVSVDGIIICRLEDQKIVEYWGSFDTLGLMKQIGALPATE